MRNLASRARCVGLLALLLRAPDGAAAAAAEPPPYDPARPLWTQLDFAASKFLMSASARVQARVRPPAEIAHLLVGTPAGRPVSPGDSVLEMIYSASGFGMNSTTTLWADPVTGGTLQHTQLDGGSRRRQRTYRFTDIGAYHYTRWPASAREEDLGPDKWTQRTEGMRPYSPGAEGKPVTEATVLLWLVAAADLSQPGQRLEAFTFSRRRVSRVIAEVTGHRDADVDYVERDAGGDHRHRGTVSAIRIRVHGGPMTPGRADEDDDFELLGLHGDLELLLDPRTRAPLQLSGRVKVVGPVTVRLRRALLR